METPSVLLFASSRRSTALRLLVAGGILFAIGLGGSSALFSAYTGAGAQSAVQQLGRAA
jgi:hypothetical protein